MLRALPSPSTQLLSSIPPERVAAAGQYKGDRRRRAMSVKEMNQALFKRTGQIKHKLLTAPMPDR